MNGNVGSAPNTRFFCDGNSHFFAPTAGAGASTIGLQHEPPFAFRPDAGLGEGLAERHFDWQQLRGVPSSLGLQQEQPQQTLSALPCAMAEQAVALQLGSLWPSAQLQVECGSVAKRNAGTRIAANAFERRQTAIKLYKRPNI